MRIATFSVVGFSLLGGVLALVVFDVGGCRKGDDPDLQLPTVVPEESPGLTREAVVKAWKAAGAEVIPAEVPVFRLTRWDEQVVANLPAPNAPFGLSLSGTPVTDAGLKDLTRLTNLTSLNLDRTQVTDAGLKELAPLTNLTSLFLMGTQVTDAGLKHLAPFKKLTSLSFSHSSHVMAHQLRRIGAHNGIILTDKGLQSLREIGLLHALIDATAANGTRPTTPDQVTSIDLGNTPVTDFGLKELACLKSLTSLDLHGTRVTDAGLKELASFPTLTTLNLRGTRVTDAGLKELASLKNLTTLSFSGPGVTGAGLKQLTQLKSLSLENIQVTDGTLQALCEIGLPHALPNATANPGSPRPTTPDEVTHLYLGGTQVTESGLKELVAFKNLTCIGLDKNLLTDAGVKDLAVFKRLTELLLSGPVSDAELRQLAPLKHLTTIGLETSCVTDKALRTLAEIGLLHALSRTDTQVWYPGRPNRRGPTTPDQVTYLDLRGTPVTSEGLKYLAPLKNLAQLYLDDTQVTDQALQALSEVGLLHALDRATTKGTRPTAPDQPIALRLGGTPVTDAGLKHLACLSNLISLDLSQTAVTDVGLKNIALLTSLTSLALSNTRVTDAGLKHLVPLSNLTALDLDWCPQVTDAGLRELGPLKNLTTLKLHGSRVTDRTLRTLREIGLLHALSQSDARGARPATPDQVLSFTVDGTRVTAAGLKHLAPLKNLAFINLGNSEVTDGVLETLSEIGLVHALPHASTSDGKRSATADQATRLYLSNTQVTGAGLKHLASLKHLTTLYLDRKQVMDAALKDLAPLTNLTTLDLSGTPVTGTGLKDLAPLTKLTSLSLSFSEVSDAGLENVAALKNLAVLSLSYSKVTSAGLKHLAPLKHLTRLRLAPTQITDEVLMTLREIGLLHALTCNVTDAGIQPPTPDEVTSLNLDGSSVTDAGLKHLVLFKNLTALSLGSCEKVTDAGLKHLVALKNLTALNLRENKQVTNEGVAELRKALPNCKIGR